MLIGRIQLANSKVGTNFFGDHVIEFNLQLVPFRVNLISSSPLGTQKINGTNLIRSGNNVPSLNDLLHFFTIKTFRWLGEINAFREGSLGRLPRR